MATRNLFFSVALLMVSLLFSLIVGEIVLRLLGYAGAPEALIGNIRHVDDPMLNWRFCAELNCARWKCQGALL